MSNNINNEGLNDIFTDYEDDRMIYWFEHNVPPFFINYYNDKPPPPSLYLPKLEPEPEPEFKVEEKKYEYTDLIHYYNELSKLNNTMNDLMKKINGIYFEETEDYYIEMIMRDDGHGITDEYPLIDINIPLDLEFIEFWSIFLKALENLIWIHENVWSKILKSITDIKKDIDIIDEENNKFIDDIIKKLN
jgi:hypothetical protein